MEDGDEEKKEEESFFAFFITFEGIILLIILYAVGLRGYHYLTSKSVTTLFSSRPYLQVDWNLVRVWFSETVASLEALINGICLLFAALIGYVIFRQREVDSVWRKQFYAPETTVSPGLQFQPQPTPGNAFPMNLPGAEYAPAYVPAPNARWQGVIAHISSENPSDWRLAILEADIVLAELLDKAGYFGDTIGDKLKNAERRPFITLNAAWEAHKVRNAIAHEGQDFELTQREARRVIDLYQAVVSEFAGR